MRLLVLLIILLSVSWMESKSTHLEDEMQDLLELIVERKDGDQIKTDQNNVDDEDADDDNDAANLQTEDERGYVVRRSGGTEEAEAEFVPVQQNDYFCGHDDVNSNRTFIAAILFAHNRLRERHGSPPLEWDPNLAVPAQEHANWMAERQILNHTDTQSKYGENLAFRGVSKTGIVYGAPPMIRAMYNEIVNPGYSFETNSGEGTGHFTQVVWKSTKLIGCGVATSIDGIWERTYLSCRYTPPGNVINQYDVNVLPPGSALVVDATEEECDIDGSCDYFKKCYKTSWNKQCSTSEAVRSICAYTCSHL